MDGATAHSAYRERISDLVARMLAKKGLPSARDEDDLRQMGLSSLDMVNLMLAVEDAFDLTLPQAKMTPDNFRSIAAIDALISGLA